MRGAYFWLGGITFGALGNLWCWRTGRVTCSQDTRQIPEPLVTVAVVTFVDWFLRHLYD